MCSYVAMGSVPATGIKSTDAIYCKIIWLLYVPVTVHRKQGVKKEYQQDATI